MTRFPEGPESLHAPAPRNSAKACCRVRPNLQLGRQTAGLAPLDQALDAFDSALTEAYDKKAPHALAEHAYRLSQAFSKFYAACPMLSAEPAIRSSRLTLAATTLSQLELTLDLLGISVPERM